MACRCRRALVCLTHDVPRLAFLVGRQQIYRRNEPAHFLPRLFSFWQEGRFPVERLMTFYDFDQIEQAAHDAESGAVIKPVLRMRKELA